MIRLRKKFDCLSNITQGYRQLIALHLLFTAGLALVRIAYFLTNQAYRSVTLEAALKLPYNWITLGQQPWSCITHGFIHSSLWSLFVHVLMLHNFGEFFGPWLGKGRFLWLYFTGIIAGAVGYIAIKHILPLPIPAAYVHSAGAGLVTILVSAAVLQPNLRLRLLFMGAVRLRYITLVYMACLLYLLDKAPSMALIQLSAMVWGYGTTQLSRQWSSLAARWHRRAKRQTVSETTMEAILDKISQKGYQSLTEKEKKQLFHAGAHQH